jgi:hypothetical protein
MVEELMIHPLDSNEILMILIVSSVGANIREYLLAKKEDSKFLFLLSPRMWISTLVSTIICYVIDPWVITISPRLVLLPPLVLGLAGIDLATKLSTIKGITTIIGWILGFFGYKNINQEEEEKEEEQTPQPEPTPMEIPLNMMVTNTVTFSKLKNLDDMVVSVLDSICNLLVAYYATNDKETFLKGYFIIMNNKNIMDDNIREFQVIHSATALKLSEIVKKEIELKRVYDNITSEVNKS